MNYELTLPLLHQTSYIIHLTFKYIRDKYIRDRSFDSEYHLSYL